MTLTPNQWVDVTVDSYNDVNNRFSDYDEIGAPGRWEFFYTGSPETFVVPSGVTRIRVECIGGGGRFDFQASSGNACPGGGGGSYASAMFDVSSAEEYDVYVGRGAQLGSGAGEHSTFDSGGGKEVRGASGSGQTTRPELCIGDIILSGGAGGSRGSQGLEGAGGGGGGGAGRNGLGINGQDGWSLGSGGSGGLGNNGVSTFLGRGGAGGRKGVIGVPGEAGSEGDPGTPEIPPQQVTKTYPATWSKSWYGLGGAHFESPLLFQGDYGGGGAHYGKMGFNTSQIRNDLLGNDINSIRLRLRTERTFWSSGLNPGARIGTHGNFSMPGGSGHSNSGHFDQYRFFNGWKDGETRWCTLPNKQAVALRDQIIGGFTTGRTGAGNTNDYGAFFGYTNSSSVRPLLEIIYTIPGQEGTPGEPGTAGSPEIPGMFGTNGRNGRFPGGGAGGAGWGNGVSTVSGLGANGYVRITEVA